MSQSVVDNSLLKATSADPAQAQTADGKSLVAMHEEIVKEMAAKEADAEPEPQKEIRERDDKGKFKAKEAEEKPNKETKEPAEKDGKPTVQERIQFRQEKREAQQRLAAREAEIEAKAAKLEELIGEMERGDQKHVRALVEEGDADGAAKAIGFESWNKLNEHIARMFASPEYKRLRAIEEREAKREKELSEQRAAYEQQQAQQAQLAQAQQAMGELHEALQASDDPIIAALAEDQDFAVAVYGAMDGHYARTGEILDIDDAAALIVEGAQRKYQQFHKAFGGRPTSQAETRSRVSPDRAGSSKQPASAKHVSRQTATEAAPPLPQNLTDAEWKELAIKEMLEAGRVDREKGERF